MSEGFSVILLTMMMTCNSLKLCGAVLYQLTSYSVIKVLAMEKRKVTGNVLPLGALALLQPRAMKCVHVLKFESYFQEILA